MTIQNEQALGRRHRHGRLRMRVAMDPAHEEVRQDDGSQGESGDASSFHAPKTIDGTGM